jgi:hypothetical protein
LQEIGEFILSNIGSVNMYDEIMNFIKISLLMRGQYERDFTKGKMLEFVGLFGLREFHREGC